MLVFEYQHPSNPDTVYRVRMLRENQTGCSCPDYLNGECVHILDAKRRIVRESANGFDAVLLLKINDDEQHIFNNVRDQLYSPIKLSHEQVREEQAISERMARIARAAAQLSRPAVPSREAVLEQIRNEMRLEPMNIRPPSDDTPNMLNGRATILDALGVPHKVTNLKVTQAPKLELKGSFQSFFCPRPSGIGNYHVKLYENGSITCDCQFFTTACDHTREIQKTASKMVALIRPKIPTPKPAAESRRHIELED